MYIIDTINSKINGTPKGVYLIISKLYSILAEANLLAHNNITISNYGQVNTFGGTIYFAADGTLYVDRLIENYQKRIIEEKVNL